MLFLYVEACALLPLVRAILVNKGPALLVPLTLKQIHNGLCALCGTLCSILGGVSLAQIRNAKARTVRKDLPAIILIKGMLIRGDHVECGFAHAVLREWRLVQWCILVCEAICDGSET